MTPIYLTLLNRLLKQFDLVWTNVGLHFEYKLNYGSISFFITNKLSMVLDFLDIEYTENTDSEYLALVFSNSKYFNIKYFYNTTLLHPDYIAIKAIFRQNKAISTFDKVLVLDDKLKLLKQALNKDLSKQIKLLKLAGVNKTELRNKFNGKLVQRWGNIPQGPMVISAIEGFKKHIENKFQTQFTDYLNSSAPKRVKSDFDVYFNSLHYTLGVKSEIPF